MESAIGATIIPFSSPVGPAFNEVSSPLDPFLHFLPDAMLQDICLQTNMYAKEVMGVEKYEVWKEVSVEEIKAYLGFSILMGLVQMPALDD